MRFEITTVSEGRLFARAKVEIIFRTESENGESNGWKVGGGPEDGRRDGNSTQTIDTPTFVMLTRRM